MFTFLLWLVLFILCWPLAAGVILYPFVWLITYVGWWGCRRSVELRAIFMLLVRPAQWRRSLCSTNIGS
jgi:hypothetical protein